MEHMVQINIKHLQKKFKQSMLFEQKTKTENQKMNVKVNTSNVYQNCNEQFYQK